VKLKNSNQKRYKAKRQKLSKSKQFEVPIPYNVFFLSIFNWQQLTGAFNGNLEHY